MNGLTRWATLALLTATASAGAVEEADAFDDTALISERARLLAASADTDAAVLGALWAGMACDREVSACGRPVCDMVQYQALVERVLAQPPEDPTQLRIVIEHLPQWLRNDPLRWPAEQARLLTQLQAQEPEVVNNWLSALPPTVTPQRRAEAALVLAHAARSTRAAADLTRSLQWIAQRLKGLPINPQTAEQVSDPDHARRLEAFSTALAVALPSYRALHQWCRDPASELAEDCRASARVLVQGDTVLDRVIGASMLRQLATTNAERLEAETTTASAQWLSEAARSCRPDNDPAEFALMETQGASEIELTEVALLAHGLPIEPPADLAQRAHPCGDQPGSISDKSPRP